MLDSNIFDRLLADPEAASELAERRDLSLLVTPVQLAELEAVPDPSRRDALLGLARSLCRTLAAPQDGATGGRHRSDGLIARTAASCTLLVTEDAGLAEAASRSGVRVQDWRTFLRSVVYGNL
ncbi:MAG: hypothetical protein JW923_09140 [Spirochaetales bacterium]|nr:hypothetical protein [Spirochaetales bacterium]